MMIHKTDPPTFGARALDAGAHLNQRNRTFFGFANDIAGATQAGRGHIALA